MLLITAATAGADNGRVSWTIDSGPHDPGAPGRDAIGWGWVIVRDGEERHITVWVTGTVKATAPEYRRPEANRALETQGRSEVELLLDADDPPGVITLDSAGRTVDPGGS